MQPFLHFHSLTHMKNTLVVLVSLLFVLNSCNKKKSYQAVCTTSYKPTSSCLLYIDNKLVDTLQYVDDSVYNVSPPTCKNLGDYHTITITSGKHSLEAKDLHGNLVSSGDFSIQENSQQSSTSATCGFGGFGLSVDKDKCVNIHINK